MKNGFMMNKFIDFHIRNEINIIREKCKIQLQNSYKLPLEMEILRNPTGRNYNILYGLCYKHEVNLLC